MCIFYTPACGFRLTVAQVLHGYRWLETATLDSSGLDYSVGHHHTSTNSLMDMFLLKKC